MKKVYIVMKFLNGGVVDKVFSSKKKAEKYFSSLNFKGFYVYHIVEKEVE